MKKLFTTLIAALMLVVFTYPAVAEEDFPPPRHNSGVIGDAQTDAAWRLGIFEGLIMNGIEYAWPAADGTATYRLQTDGAGTLSWAASGAATKWNAVGDPDGANAIDMTTQVSVFDWGGTADMMTHEFTGDFGDVTGLLLEQKTGNPTNGTVLEIKIADTDPDFLSFVTGGVEKVNIADNGDITLSAGDVSAVDLTASGDLSVGGTWSVDSIAAATATQKLTLDGDTTGGVDIGVTSTGDITLGDDVVVADTYDMAIGEGTLTIDNDQVDEWGLVITADATTTAGAISVNSNVTTAAAGMAAVSITADGVTTGDVLLLDSLAAGMTTGNFINAFNGANTVFEVGLYGATTIVGNAATDVLTVTDGDVQITSGDIDLDSGFMAINTAADQTTSVTRAQATVTGPVFSIVEDTDVGAGDNEAALFIDTDTTDAGSYGILIDSEGATGLHFVDLIAAGDGITFATAASFTGQLIAVDDTLVGTNGEGIVDIKTTGNMATGSTLVRLDADTGTLAGATDGFLLSLDDDSVGVATSYAMKIDSASNEALHVATGVSLFDETATFTAGIASTGATALGAAATDSITALASFQGAGPIILDGATDNAFDITVTVTDPTTDKNFNLPDSNVNMEAMASIGVGLTTYTESAVATEVIAEATVAVAAGHAAAGQVYTWEIAGEKTGANNTYGIILVLDGTTALTLTASDAAAATFTARITCIMVDSGNSLVYGELLENGKVTVQGRASVVDDLSGAVNIGLSMTLADAGDEIKTYNTLVTYNE